MLGEINSLLGLSNWEFINWLAFQRFLRLPGWEAAGSRNVVCVCVCACVCVCDRGCQSGIVHSYDLMSKNTNLSHKWSRSSVSVRFSCSSMTAKRKKKKKLFLSQVRGLSLIPRHGYQLLLINKSPHIRMFSGIFSSILTVPEEWFSGQSVSHFGSDGNISTSLPGTVISLLHGHLWCTESER